MGNKTLRFMAAIFMLTCLYGCNGVSQKEYRELKAENEKLKYEIHELKFGADNLLAQGKAYIETKDFVSAQQTFQSLIEKHPASPQSTEGGKLLEGVEKSLKKQQEAAQKADEEKLRKEKDRLANAVKNMAKQYDDISDVVWYRDKSSPTRLNHYGFFAYISTKEGRRPYLRFSIQYAADDWLFVNKYIIKADTATYTISEAWYGEIKKDNGTGGIWEWIDRQVKPAELEIIKAVAASKEAKIRFSGKDYYNDKVISAQQKSALRNVLDAYEALGGPLNLE